MKFFDADALIENIEQMKKYQVDVDDVLEIIDNFPTIEAVPVIHGEWVKTSEYMPIYGCSICKERNLFKNGDNVFSNFCPNCGAKMTKQTDI